jgi:hypothetical protein
MFGICAIWGKQGLPTKPLKKSKKVKRATANLTVSAEFTPCSYTGPLVPTFITADGFNQFLVRRHDDRLEEVLPRVVGL